MGHARLPSISGSERRLQAVLVSEPEDPSKPHLEDRQCLLLHVAASLLWSAQGAEPTPAAVQDLAPVLRQEMYEHACVASAAFGPPPPAMGQSERTSVPSSTISFIVTAIIRTNGAWRHFLLDQPCKHLACHIPRVSHRGILPGEPAYGWDFDESASPHVWLLVHRGHMRLLTPPASRRGLILRRAPDRDFAQIYAAGWEAHLLAGVGDPPAVLAKALAACPRCPSASLDFRSWRTGLETHAFGRAPLPELKIGAAPIRAVDTHDLTDVKTIDTLLQERLRGVPTSSDQTSALADCPLHGCDFIEIWHCTGRTMHPRRGASGRTGFVHRPRMGPRPWRSQAARLPLRTHDEG